jgi:hypothetical protein
MPIFAKLKPRRRLPGLNQPSENHLNPKKKKIILGALLLLILFVVIVFRPIEKHRMLVVKSNGEVGVAIFNPNLGNVIYVPVPPDIQIDAAYNLGLWKVESLLKLGKQENIEGDEFVRLSLVRGLGIPLESYIEVDSFIPRRISLSGAILFPNESSLSLVERLRLAFFTVGSSVEEEKFLDGLASRPSKNDPNVLSLVWPAYERTQWVFSESESESRSIVGVVTKTRVPFSKKEALDRLIAATGGKLVDFEEENFDSENECEIYAPSDYKIAKLLANTLGCTRVDKALSYPITIKASEAFFRKF